MANETGPITEAKARAEIYYFCAEETIPLADITPEMEATMLALYQRAYMSGFIQGLQTAGESILEGLSDSITFTQEQLKKKGWEE